jgi:hypothetical protein
MMFEMHHNSTTMRPWFGGSGKGITWGDVLRTMRELRSAGVRAHYWP